MIMGYGYGSRDRPLGDTEYLVLPTKHAAMATSTEWL